MKLLLIILSLNSAIAQNYSFTGSLLNFDNNVVSKCVVTAKVNTFETRNIQLSKIKYLSKELRNINLRLFVKNGIDGNLFIGEANDTKLVFNTDSNFNIFEVSILDNEDNYRCTNFYEK
jgi:hypothetical protein